MKKCYDKYLEYFVPILYCSFCKKRIEPGEKLYKVLITWGDGKSACEDCYNEFEKELS